MGNTKLYYACRVNCHSSDLSGSSLEKYELHHNTDPSIRIITIIDPDSIIT